MSQYKSDIYNLCSSTAKKALDAFCFEVNNSNADVFVVMAHKAVRLFQVLIDQKHLSNSVANKIIISNYALDFNSSYLIGKKIAVIDDILISGTSIASTVHKLLSIGIPQDDISIITLAVNKRYFSMKFDNTMGNNMLNCSIFLQDDDCIELSYTISKIFSYYGISYNIDYPNYKALELANDDINILFNNFFWQTDKITNEEQNVGNIDAYVLFPNECVRKMLWNRIGVCMEESAHLKLRIYIKNYPNGKQECYIVPMCLFNEISEQDLETLYSICKPSKGELTFHDNAYVAKMRYLQFYIAHQLYMTFNQITSFDSDTKPYETSTNLLFGIIDSMKISNELNRTFFRNERIIPIKNTNSIDESTINEFWKSDIGKDTLINIQKLKQEYSSGQEYLINRIIFMPFLWWYDTKEIPVRNDLFDMSIHYIKDYSHIKYKLKRLNNGFSLQTLKKILEKVLESYESEHLISVFIDRAIDEGIIVPTISYNEDEHCLCRVYRHGEDLPFGLQDECRLLHFLESLNEKIPNINVISNKDSNIEGIATVSFEKMIVLFYQMGLEQGNIFNRFLGFDNIKLLKPFLSVHGTVEGFIDPIQMKKQNIAEHFYSESLEGGDKYITWLTNWLLDKNFIERLDLKNSTNHNRKVYAIKRDEIHEYLYKDERSCVSSVIKENISNIASMIATWYNTTSRSEGKDTFKEDATALTSCSNTYIFASAIATEIHYFSKFWRKQAKKALNNPCDISRMNNALMESEEDREQVFKAEQALYSGRIKVDFFNSRKAETVVEKVATILTDTGVSVWKEIWNSVKCDIRSAKDDLKMYLDQAIGFLFFYSACYECLNFSEFWNTGEKPAKYKEYKQLYEEQCKKTYLLKKNLFKRIDEIAKVTDFNNKASKFYKLIDRAINDSEDSVINIEREVENNAKNYTVRYKSSLFFEVKAFNVEQVDSRIINVWNQLEENANKTQINIVRFPDDLSDNGFIRYGLFYGSNFDKKEHETLYPTRILIDLYKKLCEEFSGRAYEIKAIMIPDTPPGRMFEHNVQKNLIKNAEKFITNIIELLKTYYVANTKQQLVVAVTDYVDSEFEKEIQKMNWEVRKDVPNSSKNQTFGQILRYYNHYVHTNSLQKEIDYSIVKITCGGNIGTGFLLRTDDKIVCISCNHIFLQDEKYTPQAISDYNNEISVSLKPIKEIIVSENPNKILMASEELAILEPLWGGRIPFDMNSIISLEDLKISVNQHYGSDCQCCGYPDGEKQWSDIFKLVGASNKGYYQTRLSTEDTVEAGYSGGIVVLSENQNCILGIHEGRYKKVNGRMIPSKVIIEQINKEMLKWQNNMK